ncbi:ABC transporter ATP-binding protein [Streptomyces xylophagus]|uniref:ABC transporter ATP-binding protein n=1 Tax=Streptomyces xylophagus TaxID=285514 RepID=UPI0005B8E51A|nr:ABC transporter ATP-binding protein [Streptomyces xylophagus]
MTERTDLTDPRESPALEAVGLGRRYRRGWALRDCTFRLPAGRICALVGPNGAGKTTLLSLTAGLSEPSTGTVRLGGHPARSAEARRHTAFLSQEKALYPRFRVSDTLRIGRELNPTWHQETAERIVAAGDIPMDARVGTLSGGQRTRVAFALALGKRPRLLLLDEPMADLDPLVRRQMMDTLMAEAAQHGATVVMSSHLVSELDGVCDFLVLIGGGKVRLAGDVAELIGAHRTVSAPDAQAHRLAGLPGQLTVDTRSAGGRTTALIRPQGPLPADAEPVLPSLEELLLAHLRTDDVPPLITSAARPGAHHEVMV